MPLTHRREPLRTGIVGEVGKVFRKKRCGLQKGVVVAQIKRIIWGTKEKKQNKKRSFHLSYRSVISSHFPRPLRADSKASHS